MVTDEGSATLTRILKELIAEIIKLECDLQKAQAQNTSLKVELENLREKKESQGKDVQ